MRVRHGQPMTNYSSAMTSVIDIRPSIDPTPLARVLAGIDIEGFYGVDGAPEGKQAMKEGTMHGSGAQSPKGLAEGSVELGYKILAGEDVGEHKQYVETFAITPDNVDEYGVDSWQ